MAKAKKAENNSKPRPKLGFMNMLFVLAGADLVLFFAPGMGLGYSMVPIDDRMAWTMLAIGILLLVVGLRGIFRKR